MVSKESIWASVSNVLYLIEYKSEQDLLQHREGLKSAGLNINACQIVAVVSSKKTKLELKELSNVNYLAENDFNLFGNLKNDPIKDLLTRKYDLLVVIGAFSKRIEKVFFKANVNFTVGVNREMTREALNLNISENAPLQLTNFVKQTLEKIK